MEHAWVVQYFDKIEKPVIKLFICSSAIRDRTHIR